MKVGLAIIGVGERNWMPFPVMAVSSIEIAKFVI